MARRYEQAKAKGEFDEESQRRENAKHALERYMHYYQRWAENDKSRKEALAKMRQAQCHILERLSVLYQARTSQRKFILDAWSQVFSPSPYCLFPPLLAASILPRHQH